MKIGLLICHEYDSLKGTLSLEMFKKYVKFLPFSYTHKRKKEEWDRDKHTKKIEKSNAFDSIIILGKRYNSFSVDYVDTVDHPFHSMSIEQDMELFFPSSEEVQSIIGKYKNFTCAFLYNEEYTYVQSNSSETLFEDRNMPNYVLETLRNTPYKLGVFDKKRYDLKYNPGRQVLISYTWLMVAWKMWFGEQFFKLVPKERILSFPYATEIKELPDGNVYVQLYDKIEEPHTPDNIFRQWKWREWLDYDALEERYR